MKSDQGTSEKRGRLRRHSELPNKPSNNPQIFFQQSSNPKSRSSHHQQDLSSYRAPIKRTTIGQLRQQRLLQETQSLPSQLQSKSKKSSKYKKSQNEGNVLVDQARVKNIFKEICTQDGVITIDSLGHTLQKYKIEFSLRDLADMLRLMKIIKGEDLQEVEQAEDEEDEESRVIEDSRGTVFLGGKMQFKQFEELYRTIRHKK